MAAWMIRFLSVTPPISIGLNRVGKKAFAVMSLTDLSAYR
jgi:hypothetical protein